MIAMFFIDLYMNGVRHDLAFQVRDLHQAVERGTWSRLKYRLLRSLDRSMP